MAKKNRKILLCCIAFVVTFSFIPGTNSVSAKYPEKKIRIIATSAPGGANDLIARTVATYISPILGVRVYVDSVLGGSNAIGWREAAKSTPDGYTLTVYSSSIAIGPYTVKGFPTYDLFEAVCILALDSRVIAANWNSRFKTISDVISYAKAHPGEITVSNDGVGSVTHLAMAAFSEATGTKYTMVPFKGSGPSVLAALGGHVQLSISGSAALKPHYISKEMRPLAFLGDKRSGIYSDTPTAKELGYDAAIQVFFGVAAPKNTPKDVKKVLAEAIKKATENQEFNKILTQLGLENIFMGPEVAGPWVKSQDAFYRDLTSKIGIKPE